LRCAYRPAEEKAKQEYAPADVEAVLAGPGSPTKAAPRAGGAHPNGEAPPDDSPLAAALAEQPPPSPPHGATHHATWRCAPRATPALRTAPARAPRAASARVRRPGRSRACDTPLTRVVRARRVLAKLGMMDQATLLQTRLTLRAWCVARAELR